MYLHNTRLFQWIITIYIHFNFPSSFFHKIIKDSVELRSRQNYRKTVERRSSAGVGGVVRLGTKWRHITYNFFLSNNWRITMGMLRWRSSDFIQHVVSARCLWLAIKYVWDMAMGMVVIANGNCCKRVYTIEKFPFVSKKKLGLSLYVRSFGSNSQTPNVKHLIHHHTAFACYLPYISHTYFSLLCTWYMNNKPDINHIPTKVKLFMLYIIHLVFSFIFFLKI